MKKIILIVGLVFGFFSCIKDPEAKIPAYLVIDRVDLVTDWANEGSNFHDINTVWVFRENELLGVYDLPARVILPFDGTHKMSLVAGISENGVRLQRSQYPFYKTIEENFNIIPGDTFYFNAAEDSVPKTSYSENTNVIVVEDFNGVGFNLQKTDRSDTTMQRTNDPNHLFVNPMSNEPNEFSGAVYVREGESLVEFASNQEYELPKFNIPVFAELNFKGDVQFDVGIYAQTSSQIIQVSVVKVNPRPDEWRRIYINMTPEVSGNFEASSFKLFIT
jgi:hypothetical protein